MAGTFTVTQADPVTIHTYTAPEEGWRANSHLIELPSEIVMVDAPLLPELTREVLDRAATLGKPISRLYISHAHPDHFAGADEVGAAVYAPAPVRDRVHAAGAAITRGAYALTDIAADVPTMPNIEHVVEGTTEVIDGVQFTFDLVGPAEAAHHLVIGLPEQSVLIAQDLVYNRVHAFIAELQFDAWVAALEALESSPHDVVLPGHGLPGGRDLFAATRSYLERARDAYALATGPDDLTRRLVSEHPEHTGTRLHHLQNFFLYPHD